MSTAAIAREHQPTGYNVNAQGGPRSFSYRRQILCGLCLVLTDAVAILISARTAIFLRAYGIPLVDTHVSPLRLPLKHYLDFGWLWLLLVLFLGLEGLYTQRRTLWNEIGHLTKAIASGADGDICGYCPDPAWASPISPDHPAHWGYPVLLLPAERYWTKRILGAAGLWRKRILLLGATETARLALQGLVSDPVLGYEVVGLLGDEAICQQRYFGTYRGRRFFVLGSLADVIEQMDKTDARDVLIAMPDLEDEKVLALVHTLQPRCESIYFVPQLWGLPLMNLKIDGFLRERLMMLKLSNNLAKPWNRGMKRTFDLVVGLAISLLTLPLCLLLAALIKIDSGSPVLFVQERLGYNGRTFRCIKFRTMQVECEHLLASHLARDPAAADEWQICKVENQRSPTYPYRALFAPLESRRTAATPQCPKGRHEPRGSSSLSASGARTNRCRPRHDPIVMARYDRILASQRSKPRYPRRSRRTRGMVRSQLDHLVRRYNLGQDI